MEKDNKISSDEFEGINKDKDKKNKSESTDWNRVHGYRLAHPSQ